MQARWRQTCLNFLITRLRQQIRTFTQTLVALNCFSLRISGVVGMNPVKYMVRIAWVLILCFPLTGYSDQTDPKLKELFLALKNSQDGSLLMQVEAEIWETWYRSGQDDVDSLMQLAAGSAKSGDLATAESIYSQVIEKLPQFSEGWNRRATIRYYRNDYQGSLEDIEQTLKLEPRHFGAVWGLGMILGSQREFERAILAFERLLEIKPNASDARPRIELLKQELAKESV